MPLIRLIASAGERSYRHGMAAHLLRLLALAALLLMPAGMVWEPAAAATTSVAAGHCGEHEQPADTPAKAPTHCMACSALPAMDPAAPAAAELPSGVVAEVAVPGFHGIVPDTVTPPPKRS